RLVLVLLLTAIPSFAQGVRMSADFLPLAVGNRWVYTVSNEDGKQLGELDFSVQEHTIVGGRSFYVLSGFPFSNESLKQTQLLRYDRQERQFIRSIQDREGPLFLNDGAATNVLESDSAGLPQKFQLKTDSMTLTFQRGVGIVEARLQTPNGVQIAKIA